ncbi:MAG: ubiquitin-like small modifier protein 1 [Candidatus Thorarchaeota archaeon]|jgi:molybdopterin synthase sulfur carrier subunit
MKVIVKFYAYLRDQIGGTSVIELHLEDSATVSNALDVICQNLKIREALIDESGDIKSDIALLKNGREIRFFEGIDTPLEEGDEIAVFPLVAGG